MGLDDSLPRFGLALAAEPWGASPGRSLQQPGLLAGATWEGSSRQHTNATSVSLCVRFCFVVALSVSVSVPLCVECCGSCSGRPTGLLLVRPST